MSEGFFVSWQLWEQMTFVLAGAIVLIFCLGWAKLWWALRRNKKLVVIDEEKRIKIQHLRTSGVIIQLDQENHVPFGVRALQSGVEIDGIWVSKPKTKIPDSIKQLQDPDYSSPSSAFSNDEGSSFSVGELSPPRISFSGMLEPVIRSSRVSVESGKTINVVRPLIWSSSRDFKYKPRRSSHLRFSSSGDNQVNQDTLSQLEGTGPTAPEPVHHERNTYKLVAALDSSSDAAADSEHSSGSDSDSSLGSKEIGAKIHQSVRRTSFGTVGKRNSRGRDGFTQGSEESSTSNGLTKEGDYFSVALNSPPQSKMNIFATPTNSLDLESIAMTEIVQPSLDDIEILEKSQWPASFERPPISSKKPIFTPGSLHVNKTARKINPGFELLPAGTFTSTITPIGDAPDKLVALTKCAEEKNRKLPKRLQKRGRDSFTGKRISTKPGNT